MGIYDRDYYRKSPRGARQMLLWTQSAVGILIAINIAAFAAQLLGGQDVTHFLEARPRDVFNGQVWKLLTANFAHSTSNAWHIVGNMFFLYVLGRELEQIYGKRDFTILYLSAGILAVLAEVTSLQLTNKDVSVLGASGGVMAVAVLCALFYPNKEILIMFALPAPLWLVCVLFVLMDLLGVISGNTGVANLAHLTGALVGLLYRVLRWSHIRGWLRLPERSASRTKRRVIVEMPAAARRPAGGPTRDRVYQRIDELLAKISASGMDSLTGEELEFLRENSGKFRREE
jgi:membrane associated rhomboid family serine protease